MKQIISKGLYKEMIKRTRNFMIALLIIAITITAITFFSKVSSYNAKEKEGVYYLPYTSVSELVSILPFYMYVMGAGLAMNAFSFLNKRNSSDFYHALPYSRLNMFTSAVAACATWIMITILSVLLIPVVGCAVKGMDFCYALLPHAIIACFVGTMVVFGATVLAMSITGTGFSNIVLAGLILFMPRFITTLMGFVIECRTSYIVPMFGMGVFFNPMYNIPVGLLVGLMYIFSGLTETVMLSWGSAIYSSIVALLYLALGAWAFSKRKSEMAGNSAPGKTLQCIYRCAIGLVFALIAVTLILLDDFDAASFTALLAASVVAFLVFELITTKRFKSTLRTLPTYGFVVITAGLFAVAIIVGSNIMLGIKPNINDVASIQIDKEQYSFYEDSDFNSYTDTCIENAEIKSEEAIKLAVYYLNKNIESVKNDDLTAFSDVPSRSVTFNLKNGMSITRQIRFYDKAYELFNDYIEEDPAYKAAKNELPDDKYINRVDCAGLNEEASKDLWDKFRKEITEKGISVVTVDNYIERTDAEYVEDMLYYEESYASTQITVRGFEGCYMFTDTYCIYMETMPDTYSLYLKLLAESVRENNSVDTIIKAFDDVLSYDGSDKEINVPTVTISALDEDYFEERISQAADGKYTNKDELLTIFRKHTFAAGDMIEYKNGFDYEFNEADPDMFGDNDAQSKFADLLKKNTEGLKNCIKNAKIAEEITSTTLFVEVEIGKMTYMDGSAYMYDNSKTINMFIELTPDEYGEYIDILLNEYELFFTDDWS